MSRNEFCVDCDMKIPKTIIGQLEGDEFSDGYRCYDCSDKKKGKKKKR